MADEFWVDPRDPAFLATVVGSVSTVALYGYALLTDVLTMATVSFVLLVVALPTATAYLLARALF
jgi:hypothetical protein